MQKQLELIHLKKYLKAYSWQDPGDAELNKMDMVSAFMLRFQLGKACWCCKALSVRQQPHENIAHNPETKVHRNPYTCILNSSTHVGRNQSKPESENLFAKCVFSLLLLSKIWPLSKSGLHTPGDLNLVI